MTESTSSDAPVESNSSINITGSDVHARDIIGGDKIIRGDEIHGDKYVGYSAEQINLLLTRIQTEYRPKPYDGRSPYIGLESFQERDADKFFGRENLIADLVARVMHSAASNARAVFVAGPSGSGKSSLVRAGLIPALRKGADSEHWLYETLIPGREPLAELKRVVASFTGKLDAGDDFGAHALTDPTRLHELVNIALGDETNRRAVIVIDQFEEIFTQLTSEQEKTRAAFLQQLTHAATVENGRTLIVFTLRSDFVTNCASYPELNALVNQQFLQVGAMSPDELVSAIARPALQVGLRLDPALIAQIVSDVRGEPGALPLMQFALKDLFDAQKEKGELTLDGYVARGGLHEALERHADAEFAKLHDDEKQLARSVFGGLIEIGRGHEDTKRTANFDDLVPAGADATKVQALVRELADARLITTDQQGDKETVTLAHERLITAWAWLQRLVNENREAIALQNEIAQDAGEWDKAGREEGYLYRGARLATAQEKLQQKQLTLSGLAQEFIDAAIQAREREHAEREATRQKELEQERQRADAEERARRAAEKSTAAEKQRGRILRFAIAGVSVLALLAMLAGCFAFQQWNNAIAEKNRAEEQAIISQSKSLAAQSNLLRSSDLDASLLLGVEAMSLKDTYEARNNLFTALETTFLMSTGRGHTGSVWSVAFSPDGKTLTSGSADNTIRLWDVRDVTQPTALGTPLTGHMSPVWSVAFSPDGKTLASGSGDGTIRLWDVRDVTQPKALGMPLTGHMGIVLSVAFSPDGKTLAAGYEEKTIRLWDVRNVTQPKALGTPLTGHAGSVESVAFSPDSKTLASGSGDGTIWLWNVRDVTQPTALGMPLTGSGTIAFSPDGKTLASGNLDHTIRLWDVRDVTQPTALGTPLTGHTGYVYSVVFSPDGKTLASGSYDGTIQLWDVRDRTQPTALGTPLTGHTSSVLSVAFSPDSKTLASGSGDDTIRLWDVRDVTQPTALGMPLTGHTGSVESVAFSPDGKTLTSGNYDGTIRLWDVRDLDFSTWQTRACKIVNRNLTRAEYAQYISREAGAYDSVYAKNPTCPEFPVEPLATPTPSPTPTP